MKYHLYGFKGEELTRFQLWNNDGTNIFNEEQLSKVLENACFSFEYVRVFSDGREGKKSMVNVAPSYLNVLVN